MYEHLVYLTDEELANASTPLERRMADEIAHLRAVRAELDPLHRISDAGKHIPIGGRMTPAEMAAMYDRDLADHLVNVVLPSNTSVETYEVAQAAARVAVKFAVRQTEIRSHLDHAMGSLTRTVAAIANKLSIQTKVD